MTDYIPMNRDALIERLTNETKVLNNKLIKKAFTVVDRADFVDEDYKIEAYEDYSLPIGYDQTISQPTTVAFVLELLDLKEGDEVLDVGSGSGWTTALMASMVGKTGSVSGLEILPELVEKGQKNLSEYKFENAKIYQSNKEFSAGEHKSFNRILVSAAAKEIPQKIVDQLKVGGILVIPLGNTLMRIEKTGNGKTHAESYPGFEFVPLVH